MFGSHIWRLPNILNPSKIFRMKFNEKKLAKLRIFEDVLREKYGEPGSEARKEIDARAKVWYYAELLKDECKR